MSNSIVLDLNSVYDHTTHSENLEDISHSTKTKYNSDDHLDGSKGSDDLKGSYGKDYLQGGSGDDHLDGSKGSDDLKGSYGKDYLRGGSSHDYLTGLKDKLTTPIIRFQNTDKPGTYLFVGEQEAASIRQNYKGFKEEGIAFQVAVSKDDPLMQPFYRFKNTEKGREGTYLFAGEQEAASIRSKHKNFVEEGLAFNSYSAGAGGGTADFVRFQNKNLPGTYLFAGSSEASLVKNNPDFTSEGSAFSARG